MSVTFQIEGEWNEHGSLNLNNANARTVADMLDIPLTGPEGNVGFLEPAECVLLMARIDQLLQSDLRRYVRPYSDTHDPTITRLKMQVGADPPKGLRVISPGTDVEYLVRRLTDFYALFKRALELNKRVVWS